jgi:hypothetical protein
VLVAAAAASQARRRNRRNNQPPGRAHAVPATGLAWEVEAGSHYRLVVPQNCRASEVKTPAPDLGSGRSAPACRRQGRCPLPRPHMATYSRRPPHHHSRCKSFGPCQNLHGVVPRALCLKALVSNMLAAMLISWLGSKCRKCQTSASNCIDFGRLVHLGPAHLKLKMPCILVPQSALVTYRFPGPQQSSRRDICERASALLLQHAVYCRIGLGWGS